MRIEINPTSLLNLEHICEVLYKLHPSVLNMLVEMERSLGPVLGFIDTDNPSLEEREFMANNYVKKDYSSEPMETEKDLPFKTIEEIIKEKDLPLKTKEELIEEKDLSSLTYEDKMELVMAPKEDENKSHIFHDLRKYIQLDTDEYIPIKISIEVEDYIIGKKVRELVRALEKTRAPEQFYLNKKEMDEYAYFAEGYGLTMNEEQRKKLDKFFWGEDVKGLKKRLRKEKLYPKSIFDLEE